MFKKDKKYLTREEQLAKEKFKEMTNKAKVNYILEYYKVHIGIIMILVAMVGGYINHRYINPPDKIVFDGIIVGGAVSNEGVEEFNQLLNQAIKSNEPGEAAYASSLVIDGLDEVARYNAQTVLVTRIAAKGIDLMVMDEEKFEIYANEDALLALDSYIAQGVVDIPTEINALAKGIDGKESVYGIKTNMKVITGSGEDEEVYVALIVNSEHFDKGFEVFEYIGQQK